MNKSRNRSLPSVVQQALDGRESEQSDRLDAISQIVVGKRAEAVNARKGSGIEEVWSKAEDAYLGIDDLNRSEFSGAKWIKPTSPSGPVTTARSREVQGSTVFVPITSRYVDAGAAKLGEILLPIDDKAFSFDATPVPSLINSKEDGRQVTSDAGEPLMRDAKPDEMAAAQQSGAPVDPAAGVPITVKDLAEERMQIATKAAKKAEKRIADWMVESKYAAEMRKVLFDGARIGSGVLKAPFPERRKAQAMTTDEETGLTTLKIEYKVCPSVRSVSPWDCFPDPACGENVQNGDYFIERDYLSTKQVKKLGELPGYIKSQIDRVIKEGPNKVYANDDSKREQEGKTEKRFPTWYFYGELTRDDMQAMIDAGGMTDKLMIPQSADTVYAIVTLINDTAVRATFNPLDSGVFPYHAFPWRRRAGHWAGVGVGEQVSTGQRMTNAATRSMLNNAGKSAGAQIVLDRGSMVPGDGNWGVTPDKLWYKNADAGVDDVRKAFSIFTIPNVGDQMMKIIQYGFKLAEDSSNIPLISQGQSGDTTPDTFSGQQLQDNNANQLLRSIGYTVDDFITEPVVNQFYEWLLLDPDVPEDEKGDWQINAHGSAALVERAIQDQTIAQMGAMVKDPAFGINPRRWFAEFLKSKRLDPRNMQNTEEEQAAIDKQPPQQAPAIQAATIRAQSAEKIETIRGQRAIELDKNDTDRDTQYNLSLTKRDEATHEAKMSELALRRELAMLDYANMNKVTLDKIKADLAKEAMKLDLQKDLFLASTTKELHTQSQPQVATPAIEPPGRAPNGQAFAK